MLIQSTKDIDYFLERFGKADSYLVPIYSDHTKHPYNNSLCLVYVYLLEFKEEYIFSVNHEELIRQDILNKLNTDKRCFVFNKKGVLKHLNKGFIYDSQLLQYYFTNQTFLTEELLSNYQRWIYSNFTKQNLNLSVPLYKHIEYCRKLKDKFIDIYDVYNSKIDSNYQLYEQYFINNLYEIEKNGLYINTEKYNEEFESEVKDNIVFSEYNIYTSTGRPSNRFGGINYGALNKENGERESFISRFGKEGMLMQIDFQSYHPRLISEIVNYSIIPFDVNIYDYLGRVYFNKPNLTEEEHEEAKNTTLKLLYGGIRKEYKNIPFFKETHKFIYSLWKEFNRNGFIELPIVKRKLYKHFLSEKELHPYKLFNYYLQAYESIKNMSLLTELIEFCKDFDSKIILYQYDSFLIDLKLSDNGKFVNGIRKILEQEEKFPLSISIGNNFHQMKKVSPNKFKKKAVI